MSRITRIHKTQWEAVMVHLDGRHTPFTSHGEAVHYIPVSDGSYQRFRADGDVETEPWMYYEEVEPSGERRDTVIGQSQGVMVDAREDWDKKLAWMREKTVTRATWNDDSKLTSAETAPEPVVNDNPAKQPTVQESYDQQRAERRRVARLASGGPGLPRERIG